MDITKVLFGLNKTPEQSAEIKDQYSKLKGVRGFISKALALVLFIPLSVIRYVALMAFIIIMTPITFLIGMFAPNVVRDKIGANKASRVAYFFLLAFLPLLLGLGVPVMLGVALWKLPETFREISLGFDKLFSKITSGNKSKKNAANQADFSVETTTTSELNAKLGVQPQNTADLEPKLDESAASSSKKNDSASGSSKSDNDYSDAALEQYAQSRRRFI